MHLISKGKFTQQKVAYKYQIGLEKPIFVMPGVLILMASATLFSGIFLTLLFDDKPVTDPL